VERYLKPTVRGEREECYAITEEGAGTDVDAIEATARRDGGSWADRVADRAVQVFGGRGYMRENVAERFFRELRVERIWEGTSEIQRMIIARQLTSRGVSALA